MRFALIRAHARAFHIAAMCRVLGVSAAGYYARHAQPLCARAEDQSERRCRSFPLMMPEDVGRNRTANSTACQ
jgi:hypothetical protein